MDWNKFREDRRNANLELLNILHDIIENETLDFRLGQLIIVLQTGNKNDFFNEEPQVTLKRWKNNEIYKKHSLNNNIKK